MAPSLTLLLLLSLRVLALSPDPSGQSKVGNGQHQSSIGSQCLSSLDCGANGNTACCATLPQAGGQTIGICSGCGATTQQGKQGCGFGDAGKNVASDPQVCPASSFAQGVIPGAEAASNASASVATSSSTSSSTTGRLRRVRSPNKKWDQRRQGAEAAQRRRGESGEEEKRQATALPDPTLDSGAGNGRNAQFVTGRCVGAKDCGAGQADLSNVCCASVVSQADGQTVGVCSGTAVGDAAPKLGCGFGDGLADSGADAAAAASGGASSSSRASASSRASSPTKTKTTTAAAATATGAGAAAVTLPDPNLNAGKGNQQNKQFVTGACVNSKDCGASQSNLADVCCASVVSGGQTVGVCSGSAVGNAAPKTGCGFGDGKANSAA